MISRRDLLRLLGAIGLSAPGASADPVQTRLLFGGDVMLSRFVGRVAHARHDPSAPLRDLAPLLSSADIAFVNLESPFSDKGSPVLSGMVFKAEPDMIAALQIAGIDIVSTANNHARDRGGYGIEFTLNWLSSHGIAAVGTAKMPEAAHAGVILVRHGLRFGFLAYTYDQSNGNHSDVDDRVAMMDPAQMARDVKSLDQRADVVIVSMHAGREYSKTPTRRQIEFAHTAIDSGAKVVVGHHPHVVQRWEPYGSGVIFYSLGNLVFDQFQRVETQHGLLAEVVFSGATLAHAAVIPVDIGRTGPRVAAPSGVGNAAPGQPAPPQPQQKQTARNQK